MSAQRQPEFVSGVKNVAAPDGSSFDILRGASEVTTNLRGNALVRMREIVRVNEPEILHFLNAGPGISAEYAMSSGIMHSKKPGVKADLTKISVEEHLAEGDRWGAVHMLAYAKAAELPLIEYGEPFVAEQYDISLEEGDPGEAWRIARTMLSEGDKIAKIEPEVQEHATQAWAAREKRAFELHAEEVLARTDQHEGAREDWDLRSIFEELRFRQDGGFNSEIPSELAKRVAEKVVQQDLQTKGREWTAIIDATEAKMSNEYIAQLRGHVPSTGFEKVKNWWSGIKARLETIIPRQ
ncbi:hypothetical protein HYT74_01285 [Candidatus Daviesbacteria bacterium]|nr:hypothetical protein [Candidatus Daviesbacteria bacterium]